MKLGPHLVAALLAVALVLAVGFIGTAIILNITTESSPAPTLGENTTQVLIGLVGGVVGVLGSYLGRWWWRGEDPARDRDEAES